jgi:hypothetical protein
MKSTFVLMKRDIEICMPVVEENPGFVACPPPFTAKGVRVDPRIRSYENAVSKSWLVESDYLTILLTSSTEPGSTEQADFPILEELAWLISSEYSGVA